MQTHAAEPRIVKPTAPQSILPAYIGAVLEELATVEFEIGCQRRRPLPDRWVPIVICVVKNERNRLDDFLRHYRAVGVERFVFVDNKSDDGTWEQLVQQPDADVYRRPGKFDWMRKQGWINKIIEIYGRDRWYIYVDADEHIVFDQSEEFSVADLTRRMERRGVRRVRGFLLDMYADGPILEARYIVGEPLAAAYPFYDREGYREEHYQEVISFKGGPRMRAFAAADPKFLPELTKYPLFWAASGEYMVNPHHIWPYEGNFSSDRYLAILHYKFLPDIMNKVEAAIGAKNYWDSSREYCCYAKILKDDPKLSLFGPVSARFNHSSDLVGSRLIAPLRWEKRPQAAIAMASAYRGRRAFLLRTAGASEAVLRDSVALESAAE
jgi:glycosyltransferase involved in cell wall biosynthesis